MQSLIQQENDTSAPSLACLPLSTSHHSQRVVTHVPSCPRDHPPFESCCFPPLWSLMMISTSSQVLWVGWLAVLSIPPSSSPFSDEPLSFLVSRFSTLSVSLLDVYVSFEHFFFPLVHPTDLHFPALLSRLLFFVVLPRLVVFEPIIVRLLNHGKSVLLFIFTCPSFATKS